MRILLTGSSGLIGSAIAARLSIANEVIGLDRVPGPFTSEIGDIRDARLMHSLCSNVDAVVHTASLHAPHVGKASEQEFFDINVTGTKHLLDACRRNSIKRFVYTSTTSVYGDAMLPKDRAVWVTEDLEPKPRDIYDDTKLLAEKECGMAAREGLTCLSLRMSRCFPEPERIMAIYRMYRGVDARDVAEAHSLALTASITGFDIFNISAASPFAQEDTEALHYDAGAVVQKYYPWVKDEFIRRGWDIPTTIDRVYVIEKAVRLMGYRPRYNFTEMFR